MVRLTPNSAEAVLRVVASCSIHPISEEHRQAVQSALFPEMGSSLSPVTPAGSGKRREMKLPACIRRSHRAYYCDALSRCQNTVATKYNYN
jgi:hypothetical protein